MVLHSHIMDVALFKSWLKENKFLSDSSVWVFTIGLKGFLERNPDLEKLEDYNTFLIDHTIKKRSTHYFSMLRHYIDYKITDSALKKKLLDGLIRPPMYPNIKRERKHLSEEQLIEIINMLQRPKHRIIALIQALTGVRAGDILRLKRGSIYPEEYKSKVVLRINIIGKGSKRNVIFIHDPVAHEIILDYITNHVGWKDYYFVDIGNMKRRPGNINSDYGMIARNYQRFWEDLKAALQTAGVKYEDFATHDFRRCFARRVWEKYKDIHVLQSLLNHTDPKVTLKYLEQSGLKNIDYLADMQGYG